MTGKTGRYRIEALLVHALALLFAALPAETASNLGGWIGRTLGTKLSASRKAVRHLQRSIPAYSDEKAAQKVIRKMWENLGRTFAEYPHLETLAAKAEIIGTENLLECKDSGKPVIYFSGHLANWEVTSVTIYNHGIPLGLVYRAPNNSYVDGLLDKYRTLHGKLFSFPKSARGMRDMMKALKEGLSIGILIDQKYNEGIETLFFGQPAMTSSAFIKLGQRSGSLLLPVRIERVDGIHFRVTYHKAIQLTDAENAPRDDIDIINEAQGLLEKWITERPDQWLWVHRRWLSEHDRTKRKLRDEKREKRKEKNKEKDQAA
ncbi:MAG: lysophospholipid acyltransferase family protein [Pseudobdellovibrionaceae bacterium]